MSRVCSSSLCVAAWLASIAAVHGEEAKPRNDLYGDPLPPRAVARMGTVQLRHANAIFTFSPDARQLVSWSPSGDVCIWDVKTGKVLDRKLLWWSKEDYDVGFRDWSEIGALAPDGTMVARQDGDTIFFFDTKTGKSRSRLKLGAVKAKVTRKLAFSSDGKVLIVCTSDSKNGATVQWWDIKEGSLRRMRVFADGARQVLFSADGRRVIAAEQLSSDRDIVRVWDAATGKEVRQFLITRPPLALDYSRIEAIGISADGKRVTALAYDWPTRATQVYHWHIDTGKLLSKRSYPIDSKTFGAPSCIAPDGERLCLNQQGKVVIEDAATGRRLSTLPETVGNLVAFSPDGRLVAATN